MEDMNLKTYWSWNKRFYRQFNLKYKHRQFMRKHTFFLKMHRSTTN